MLKSNAVLGRTFTRDEMVVGADRVVVLSHGFWSRALGADRSIVGKHDSTRLGALHRCRRDAAGIRVPDRTKVEVWTPLAFNPKDIHGPCGARG